MQSVQTTSGKEYAKHFGDIPNLWLRVGEYVSSKAASEDTSTWRGGCWPSLCALLLSTMQVSSSLPKPGPRLAFTSGSVALA